MVRLETVSGKNVWDILKLSVKEEQKSFVSSNDRSIIEAYIAIARGGYAFPFGIYHDDVLVGFMMIGYGVDEDWVDAPEIAYDNYNIWRLMIDQKHQHSGYGHRAVELALDFIRTWPCGKAKYCWLSYEPENATAKKLYQEHGFVETGDMDGNELIAILEL